MKKQSNNQGGFSLVELIISIVLMGIIASMIANMVSKPFEAYINVSSRLNLVAQTDVIYNRIGRELKNSIPNSIRVKNVGDVWAIEFYNVVDAIRYRTGPDEIDKAVNLHFYEEDIQFNLIGTFDKIPLGVWPAGYQLVLYNTPSFIGTTDAPAAAYNLYGTASLGPLPLADAHVITPTTTTITTSASGTETAVLLSTGHRFTSRSPGQLMYVTNGPVTFLCDQSTNTLTRISNYTTSSIQPTAVGAAPLASGNADLMAQNIESCRFVHERGTSLRQAVVTLELTLLSGFERIRLVNQVFIPNVS